MSQQTILRPQPKLKGHTSLAEPSAVQSVFCHLLKGERLLTVLVRVLGVSPRSCSFAVK